MDNQKIKKGANMMGVMTTMLLFIGIIMGCYVFFSENMAQVDKTVDTKYTDFYGRVTASQTEIDTLSKQIDENFQGMKENDNLITSVWNGIRGLGSTLILFGTVPALGVQMGQNAINVMDQVPTWIWTLVSIFILTVLVVVVLKVLKGEPGGID